MATPYANVGAFGEEQDSYNYYHSNLRIKIECAFGILVQRFGYLRRIAPRNHKIKKVIAIVACLCRVHNWLIDRRVGPISTSVLPAHTDDDALAMAIGGAVSMESRTGHGRQERFPNQLMDGGEHFGDDPGRVIHRGIARPNAPTTLDSVRDSNRLDHKLLRERIYGSR